MNLSRIDIYESKTAILKDDLHSNFYVYDIFSLPGPNSSAVLIIGLGLMSQLFFLINLSIIDIYESRIANLKDD